MRAVIRLIVAASFVLICATALIAQGAKAPARPVPQPAVKAQAKVATLTNADVLLLVALQVSEATVIAVVNEAKVTKFDLSAPAVGDLVLRGVSTAVIAAMRQPSAPVPAVAAVEAAPSKPADGIDRQKFDKVYAAGKAVDSAKTLALAGVTPREFQRLLLAFDTELKILEDKVSGRAESELASQYAIAKLQFETALLLLAANNTLTHEKAGMYRASATLEAANRIYLGK